MNRKSTLLILLIAVLAYACGGGDEKYPGYTQADEGVYYQLHIAGETGKKAGDGDYYEIVMVNSYGGKVFYDSRYQTGSGTLFVESNTSPYFSVLAEGDSASFILPGGDMRMVGTPDTGMVEMSVKVLRIVTADEYANMDLTSDPDADEQLEIGRYMAAIGSNEKADSTGLIFIEEKAGTGNTPHFGGNATVNYKGYFLNGGLFDDSYANDSSFTFSYGAEGQVLPGIQRALSRMKAGGKAKIILPSGLAFGSDGSSSGIIPPHTPVVYELELVSAD